MECECECEWECEWENMLPYFVCEMSEYMLME